MLINSNDSQNLVASYLGKPSKFLRFTYYILLMLLISILFWSWVSVTEYSVHAFGQIRPVQGFQQIQSSVTNKIEKLFVTENTWVNNGDTVCIINRDQLFQNENSNIHKIELVALEIQDLENLKSLNIKTSFQFPQYKKDLQYKLKDRELIKKEIKLLYDKYFRDKKLREKSYISSQEFEQSESNLQQKQLKSEQWKQNHEREISQKIQLLEEKKQELENDLELIQIEKEKYILKAPISGFITQLNYKSTNLLIKTGDTFCIISPEQNQVAEFFIPAKDIGFIKEGLKVNYQIDALPYYEWGMAKGNVQSISKDFVLNEKSQTVLFKIVGDFDSLRLSSSRKNLSAELKTGMTFRANIVVAQKRIIDFLWDKSVDYFAL